MAEVALQWSPETVHASVAANGLPSTVGLTLMGIEADSVSVDVQEVAIERAEATRRSTAEASDSPGKGGGKVIHRGSITITKEVEMPGASATSELYDLPGLLCDAGFLATLLSDDGTPPAQTDDVDGGVDLTSWTPTTIANLGEGRLVGFKLDGRYQSTRITGTSGAAVTASPALTADPAGDTGRLMRQFYANKGWARRTVYIQYDGRGDGSPTGPGQRFKMFGCKLSEFEWTVDEAGRLMATYTLQAAYVEVDNLAADIASGPCVCDDNFITATGFDGGSRLGAEYCGKGGTQATPARSALVDPFYAGRWRFKMTAPLTAIEGTNRNNIGHCGWRVGKVTTEADVPMCETSTVIDNDRDNKAKRMLVLDAGVGDAGAGVSIHLAGAQLRKPPYILERSDDGHIQSLMYKSGGYCSDTTTNPTGCANAWLIIGWQL